MMGWELQRELKGTLEGTLSCKTLDPVGGR
jgi:hypothetical protein